MKSIEMCVETLIWSVLVPSNLLILSSSSSSSLSSPSLPHLQSLQAVLIIGSRIRWIARPNFIFEAWVSLKAPYITKTAIFWVTVMGLEGIEEGRGLVARDGSTNKKLMVNRLSPRSSDPLTLSPSRDPRSSSSKFIPK